MKLEATRQQVDNLDTQNWAPGARASMDLFGVNMNFTDEAVSVQPRKFLPIYFHVNIES